MVLQVGRGSYIPDADCCPGLRLEAFRFKKSIVENIQSADVVISHAGKKPKRNSHAKISYFISVDVYSCFRQNLLNFLTWLNAGLHKRFATRDEFKCEINPMFKH